MKVIGLTGFAKSGKSTAATILREMGGYEIAFAKHLKDVCSFVFGVPREHFDDQAFKEQPLSFTRIITGNDIERILNYFEVPARFIPESVMKHVGVQMNTPRYIAQYVGTEVLRSIESDIHINMAFKLAPKDAPFFICSDMRFMNELQAVTQRDGLTIGISRKAATPENIQNLHASEREIPTLIGLSDLKATNETTIADFQKTIKLAAETYLKK
jgi:hypothetical protein